VREKKEREVGRRNILLKKRKGEDRAEKAKKRNAV